jgi:hypothetical protein
MPLSQPAERELLHLRDIAVRGYRRSDGLFDVEAEITDTKSYSFRVGDRGDITPGEKLHNMVLRLTVDATLTIVAAEAVTEAAPFSVCPGGAATFGRLAGLRIGGGFLKEANARLGGVEGCTHIRELLQQMATVAVQTSYVLPARSGEGAGGAERLINSCHGYSASGPVVQRRWPQHYTGPAPDAAAAG